MTLAYFPNGNLQSITGPANQAGQRYRLDYEYDPDMTTHVTRVTDSFGLSSQAAYDLRFGRIAVSLDTNTTTAYDTVGRITAITGPYEQMSGFNTLSFEYHPEGQL